MAFTTPCAKGAHLKRVDILIWEINYLTFHEII